MQKKDKRLNKLIDLIGKINSKMELQSLLGSVMEAAKDMMMSEACSLFLLDEKSNELIVTHLTGPADQAISGIRIPISEGIVGWVATHKQPLIVNDVSTDSRFNGDFADGDLVTKNLICVPMIDAKGKLIGVLEAINRENNGTFEEDDIPLFQLLANQAAISLERERIHMNVLLELIGQINSKMDLDSLLSAIMEASKIIMKSEASSLMLLDDEKGELMITVPTGPANKRISGTRIPMGKGIAGWVAVHKEPVVINDVTKDSRFGGDIKGAKFVTRNMVCVPMLNAERKLIGVLQAINRQGNEPYSDDDIPIFRLLADQAAISLERERLHRESLEKQRLEEQISVARDIQMHFWPKKLPEFEGYDIYGSNIPALQVGGDYYDFMRLDEQRLAIAIADVSGKGVGASLIMATLRATLRTQLLNNTSITHTIEVVNQAVKHDTRSSEFVTMFFAILDTKNHTFEYVNAGHNPPYLVDASGKRTELLVGGPIIGILEGIPYASETISMEQGSVVYMFTDGVTEAVNEENDMYDEERLEKLIDDGLDGSAQAIHDRVFAEVLSFQGKAEQADDITVITLKRNV